VAPFGGGIGLLGKEGKEGVMAERVARGRNFMISLGIPFAPGALPMPSELIVLSNVAMVIMSARVMEVSPRGSMTKRSGLSGCSHGGMGRTGGVARLSSASKYEWTALRTSVEEVTVAL
jgi:hypothetical protein